MTAPPNMDEQSITSIYSTFKSDRMIANAPPDSWDAELFVKFVVNNETRLLELASILPPIISATLLSKLELLTVKAEPD